VGSNVILSASLRLPGKERTVENGTKQPDLRFRALLTDGAREVRFERAG
jgi:hypothetical protein